MGEDDHRIRCDASVIFLPSVACLPPGSFREAIRSGPPFLCSEAPTPPPYAFLMPEPCCHQGPGQWKHLWRIEDTRMGNNLMTPSRRLSDQSVGAEYDWDGWMAKPKQPNRECTLSETAPR